MTSIRRRRLAAALLALAFGGGAQADVRELPEYRLKAAFLFNFMLYTEWPDAGPTLTLCVAGADPFGKELDGLAGRMAGTRRIAVQRRAVTDELKGCQVVFIAESAIERLPRLLELLQGQPVLTVADSTGAARRGVALNMTVAQDRIAFEANLQAARAARLGLSSKLLRLATEVIQ